jgi:hypothetical protein
MNDIDEFVEITLAIFASLTLLIWLLTRLEQTLLDPPADRRSSSPRPSGTQHDPNDPAAQ